MQLLLSLVGVLLELHISILYCVYCIHTFFLHPSNSSVCAVAVFQRDGAEFCNLLVPLSVSLPCGVCRLLQARGVLIRTEDRGGHFLFQAVHVCPIQSGRLHPCMHT